MVTEASRVASTQEIKFIDQLDIEKERFAFDLQKQIDSFEKIKLLRLYSDVQENTMLTNSLKEIIDNLQSTLKSFNEREVIFKQPISEYVTLNDLEAKFEPFYKIWDYCSEFDIDKQDWTLGPFLKLDFHAIDKKIDNYLRNSLNLMK